MRGDKMRFVYGLPYWVVIWKLDTLNNARRMFEEAVNEEARERANLVFADCYDWLVDRGVSIYYDEKPKLWLLRLH
jgi:hypothetical protein